MSRCTGTGRERGSRIWTRWCVDLRVAALVEAVLAAVLPHPGHVLDRVVVVGNAVVVDLGDSHEEGVEGGGDVVS